MLECTIKCKTKLAFWIFAKSKNFANISKFLYTKILPWTSYPHCLLRLSCPGCPVLAVLSRLTYGSCPVTAFLYQQSCPRLS
jgi:hypothetical protein